MTLGITPPERFVLTPDERDSRLWGRLQEHFAARVAKLREQNDAALPHDETLTLRGQIRCFKELIRLGEEPPIIDG